MSSFKQRKRKKRTEKIKPESQLIFDQLCEVLQKIGIRLRVETGHFSGGLCIVQEEVIFFLNKEDPIDQKTEILISQLSQMDLDGVYLSPKLRSLFEEKEFNVEE